MQASEPSRPPRSPGRLRRLILIGLSVLVVLLTGYTTWSNLRTHTLTATIDIDAPPQKVWEALIDRSAYPQWNPYIVSSTGGLKEGGTITNVIRDADGSEAESTATVLVIKQAKELRWHRSQGPGLLFEGEHSFRLIKRGAGTRFVHSGSYSGALVPPSQGWLEDDKLRQFKAMNKALKRHLAKLED